MSIKTLEQYEEDCLHDIKEAYREDLIIFTEKSAEFTLGPRDPWSHIYSKPEIIDDGMFVQALPGGIRIANDASLSPLGEHFLRAVCKRTPSPRVLVMGPGAGFEVSQISKILQDANATDAVVETVSLTPINPFLRFSIGADEARGRTLTDMMRMKIEAFLKKQELTAAAASIRKQVSEVFGDHDHCQMCFPMGAVLAAQDRFGIEIFEKLRRPYIDRQYIGEFSDKIELGGQYDFIYDNRGVMAYTTAAGRRKALRLRAPEGVFFYAPFIGENSRGQLFTGEDLVLTGMDGREMELSCAVIVSKTSEIGRRLMAAIGDQCQFDRETEVTRVENMWERLKEALPLAAFAIMSGDGRQ